MAQAYGIKNYKFDNPETLGKDLEVILEDVPMFIEVDISRKEHVLPMVPAGKSNHEMLGGEVPCVEMLNSKTTKSIRSPQSLYRCSISSSG